MSNSPMNEQLTAVGSVLLQTFDANGVEIERQEIHNLVVTAGRSFMAARMKDATAAAMSHMAVGTNATAAAAADTTLGTEAARVALDSTAVAANVVTYKGTFAAGTGTGSIVEAGLFNANAGGTMLARTVFGVQTKGAGDSLVITWTVTINAA